MAKKIRFALRMNDNIEVRTLPELQEHFDIDSVMGYYLDGKLETWLEDRYYETEIEQIQALDREDPDLSRRLCEIFDVEYVRDALSQEEIETRNQKIEHLKEFTDDEEILAKVDSVAFSQEELADLLDEGLDTIYLCGEGFQIPSSKKNMTYIGIQTALTLTDEQHKKYKENGICFIDLLNDEATNEFQVAETVASTAYKTPSSDDLIGDIRDGKINDKEQITTVITDVLNNLTATPINDAIANQIKVTIQEAANAVDCGDEVVSNAREFVNTFSTMSFANNDDWHFCENAWKYRNTFDPELRFGPIVEAGVLAAVAEDAIRTEQIDEFCGPLTFYEVMNNDHNKFNAAVMLFAAERGSSAMFNFLKSNMDDSKKLAEYLDMIRTINQDLGDNDCRLTDLSYAKAHKAFRKMMQEFIDHKVEADGNYVPQSWARYRRPTKDNFIYVDDDDDEELDDTV